MLSFVTAVVATLSLVLTGVMAGLFVAFSNSIMPALDAIKPEAAIRAMQSINRKILNPVFFLAFMGAPVAAAATGVLLLALGDQTDAALIFFIAAAVYFLGTFVLTIVVNVPMNNALDRAEVPAGEADAARFWADYSPRWTRWNTIRGAFNVVSLLLIGLALFVWGRQG